MFKNTSIFIIQMFVVSFSAANTVDFQKEKTYFQDQLTCDSELIYPETQTSGAKWNCKVKNGAQSLQIIRKLNNQNSVESIELLVFSELNSPLDEDLMELCRSIAEKYGLEFSQEIMNILSMCENNHSFSQSKIDVGCMEGPVKVERHLFVQL